ncbi:hypothetical protein [Pseudonocardia sp. NPDC049154]|uniref:hypothetical protein n=1 Tax=Pseudonocardia sp. NPDC049154 TaxID=3155501 RepID=UPI0034085641
MSDHPPGGRLTGRYDDAALFAAIATVLDAQAAPLTADDDRSSAERHAEALAEVCGWVLEHGELPAVGGRRPIREPGQPQFVDLRWWGVVGFGAIGVEGVEQRGAPLLQLAGGVHRGGLGQLGLGAGPGCR